MKTIEDRSFNCKELLRRFASFNNLDLDFARDKDGKIAVWLSMEENGDKAVGIAMLKDTGFSVDDSMYNGYASEDEACKNYLTRILGSNLWFIFYTSGASKIASHRVVQVPSTLEELCLKLDINS